MAGKHASEGRRRKQAEAGPQSSPKPARAKKGAASGPLGWPWWLWVTGAIGLIVCVSQIFFSQTPKLPLKGGKKKGGKGGKENRSGPPDTTRYLELAMRLQEMTTLASIADSSGNLDAKTARELDEELTSIEAEVQGVDDTIARDIRAMISVVRGTLFQRGDNLTDEQVEKMQNSYTYANPRYWDDYYNKTADGERFDWYGSWDTRIQVVGAQESATTLGGLMEPHLAADSQVLMLGCGNSNMSEQMYSAGFEHIVNVDISEQLLQNLRRRLGPSMPNMRWVYANASALEFDDGQFDVVVDKGTLDAIEQNRPLLLAAIAESHRTLRPGGILLSITFNDRELRVVGQLDQGASWVDCSTHPFERATEKTQGKSTFFLHACHRPST